MAAQLGVSSFRGTQLQFAQPGRRCQEGSFRLQIIALKPIQGKVVSTAMEKTAVVQVRKVVLIVKLLGSLQSTELH